VSVLLVGGGLRWRSHSDLNITAGCEKLDAKSMAERVKWFKMSGILLQKLVNGNWMRLAQAAAGA
jgi:hypothetical protein